MLQPRLTTIDTTQGEITFAALKASDLKSIQRITRQMRKAQKADPDADAFEYQEQLEAVVFSAVAEADRPKLDSLEAWEYSSLQERIIERSGEAFQKN